MRAKGREGEEAGEEYLAIVIDGVGKEKEGRRTKYELGQGRNAHPEDARVLLPNLIVLK
jgi:hypothetical protein